MEIATKSFKLEKEPALESFEETKLHRAIMHKRPHPLSFVIRASTHGVRHSPIEQHDISASHDRRLSLHAKITPANLQLLVDFFDFLAECSYPLD